MASSTSDISTLADQLEDKGYVVLQIGKICKKIDGIQQQLKQELESMPELKDGVDVFKNPLVGGGFCALGSPSTFHLETVRKLRQLVYERMIKKFWPHIIGDKELFLEFIIDRLMVRPYPKKPAKESWHRDLPKDVQVATKTTYGGWLNLNTYSQYFCCVPGTQIDGQCDGQGFATINDKDEIKRLNKLEQLVEIPSGCLIIFQESIIHRVAGAKVPSKTEPMLRLFMGWRITEEEKQSVVPDLDRRLDDFDIIPLKSGQTPSMWPHLYMVNHPHMIEDLSNRYRDGPMKETVTRLRRDPNSNDPAQKKKVKHVNFLKQFSPSLKRLGLKCPKPYSIDERRMHFSHNIKILKK